MEPEDFDEIKSISGQREVIREVVSKFVQDLKIENKDTEEKIDTIMS
jgi:hypothetical protein